MTNTEFKRMCTAVEKNGWYTRYEAKSKIEVMKHDRDIYVVYHSRKEMRRGKAVYMDREVVDRAENMEKLKYLFVY